VHNIACKIIFNYPYEISIGQVCDHPLRQISIAFKSNKPTLNQHVTCSYSQTGNFSSLSFSCLPLSWSPRTTIPHSTLLPLTTIQVYHIPKIPTNTPVGQSDMCPRYPHNPPSTTLLIYCPFFPAGWCKRVLHMQTPPPSLRGRCHHNPPFPSSSHKPATVVLASRPPSSLKATHFRPALLRKWSIQPQVCLLNRRGYAQSTPLYCLHLRSRRRCSMSAASTAADTVNSQRR